MADFPEGFLWGSSTAAHQVEGSNVNNDWWAWEHTDGSTAVEPSGDAIDQYHRYREDFELLAGLGQNAHRLSLEWSRIEPASGEWSSAALGHYRRVLECLAENGLTAFVTLHHFTNPRWFAERGGWLAADAVERFARYCERVASELGGLMPWTCTINEPQIVALFGYREGMHPPGHSDEGEWRRVTRTLIEAHRVAAPLFERAGICLQLPAFEAGDPRPAEMVEPYLEDLPGEFAGVQYYTLMREPPGALVVTENGIATGDDSKRVDYLESHLGAVKRALDEGIDVRGYLYWSSFDNFEWAEGYRPTFGLVGIERDRGLRRVVRPRAEAFGRVARSNELSALRAV